MTRITQLQPAQALDAAKKLDNEKDAARIKSLAHEMNIAASPEVPAGALKEKILEVLEYHLAKLDRKQKIADGEKDVPDLPKKPALRVTVEGKHVPALKDEDVSKVKAEPKKKADTKKEDKDDDKKKSS